MAAGRAVLCGGVVAADALARLPTGRRAAPPKTNCALDTAEVAVGDWLDDDAPGLAASELVEVRVADVKVAELPRWAVSGARITSRFSCCPMVGGAWPDDSSGISWINRVRV